MELWKYRNETFFIDFQAFCGEAMFIVASILHLGKSGIPKKVSYDITITSLLMNHHRGNHQAITEDDVERLSICLRVLSERSDVLTQVFGEGSREALGRLLQTREADAKKNKKVRNLQYLVSLS